MELQPELTTLLVEKSTNGDQESADHLFRALYTQLRRDAERMMSRERPDHTWQPTVLVHEAFVRVSKNTNLDEVGRAHLRAICCRAMCQALVDHARQRRSRKRGGGLRPVPLEEAMAASWDEVDPLHLAEALQMLGESYPRAAQVVQMYHYGRHTFEEIARELGIVEKTARTDLRFGIAWLRRTLSKGDSVTRGSEPD